MEYDPIRVAIVGAGNGGLALLKLFQEDSRVILVGVADLRRDAPGILLADSLNIPVFQEPYVFLEPGVCDIVIDVTGCLAVEFRLRGHAGSPEVISGQCARFLWQLIQDRMESNALTKSLLKEYEILYEMSLALSRSENLSTLSQQIINYAGQLLKAPFIALISFSGPAKKMIMHYVSGSKDCLPPDYSDEFKLRLLQQTGPFFVKDPADYPKFGNPFECSDELASLWIMPLKMSHEIIGALYVGDYEVREFTPHELSLITLVANVAMPMIQRLNLLDNAHHLAVTDELTQLYNHRHFIKQIDAEISRSLRCNRLCSLLMLDIDFFKHYNDTNGHEMGNEVLRIFAGLLKNTCRCTDWVARYGGEEFVVIMPETDLKESLRISERIRYNVENYAFPHGEKQPSGKLTVSIGIASFPKHAKSFSDLINSADSALYCAKNQGRNAVSVYG